MLSAQATHRVTMHIEMLVQVDVVAQDNTTPEEFERLAEVEIAKDITKIRMLDVGVGGWRGDDLLVAELDENGQETSNPHSDPYPEHYRRTKTGWVINDRGPRARERKKDNGS